MAKYYAIFWFALLLWIMAPLQAQDKFYLQLLEEGKQRFIAQDYGGAATYLEIAAFGFLDFPDQLFEAYVCQVVVFAESNDEEAMERIMIKLRTTFRNRREKPPTLPDEIWSRYQTMVDEDNASPDTPLPNNRNALNAFLENNPKNVSAWVSLIELSKANQSWGKLKKTFERALKANPGDTTLLQLAITVAHDRNQNKSGDQYALRLLDQNPSNSLAHEFLGNRATEKRDWDRANEHFAHVTQNAFPESEKNKAILKRKLESRKPENEKDDKDNSRRKDQATKAPNALTDTIPPKKNHKGKLSARQLESLLKKSPDDMDARYDLVTKYLTQDQVKKAKKHLHHIGTVDPGNPRYLELFSQYCYKAGLFKTNVEQLIPKTNRTQEADLFLGLSLIELGRADEAKTLLLPLDRGEFPQLYQADQRIASILASNTEKSDTQDREVLLRKLKVLLDSDTATYAQRTQYIDLIIEQDDWEKAAPLIKAINKSHPTEPLSQYFLARQLMKEKDYKQAAQMFSNLTNAGYYDKETFYFGGMAYYHLGKKEFANYLFSRALRSGTAFQREISEIQTKLAREKEVSDKHLTVQSQLEKKIEQLKAEQKPADDIECQVALLRLYHEVGRKEDFEILYKQMRNAALNREQGDLVLAWRMVSRQQNQKALRLIENYECPEAIYLKGYLFFLLDQPRLGNQTLADLKHHRDRFPELTHLIETGHL